MACIELIDYTVGGLMNIIIKGVIKTFFADMKYWILEILKGRGKEMKIKREIIIFMIAFFLLSFLEISCLAQESEESRFSFHQESFNYAEFWNSLSYNEKVIYLLGVSGGIKRYASEIEDFFLTTVKFPYNSAEEGGEEAKKVSNVTGILFGWQNFVSCGGYRAIINNMDDLYKDSDNMYISMIDMGFLSYYKIKPEPVELLLKVMRERGEPIESLLKELRERFWE